MIFHNITILCIFDQINAALVSIRNVFKKTLKIFLIPNYWMLPALFWSSHTCREVDAAPMRSPRDWATRAVEVDRAIKSRYLPASGGWFVIQYTILQYIIGQITWKRQRSTHVLTFGFYLGHMEWFEKWDRHSKALVVISPSTFRNIRNVLSPSNQLEQWLLPSI